jgi:Fe2+ or Zn2+ uptake regulation protein
MLPILFNNDAPRTDNLLTICSWCNKIETGNGKWQEVEEAVESLGLFELETLPLISHGMCDSCYQTILLKLEELKTQ